MEKGFEKMWPLGVALSTANLLFLGDYVDRGPHSVEVALHLLAIKCIAPRKVFLVPKLFVCNFWIKVILLRGNHEDKDVNSDVDVYGEGSFLKRCEALYGNKGQTVFDAINDAFACMPIAALVDEQVFDFSCDVPFFLFCRSFVSTGVFREKFSLRTTFWEILAAFRDLFQKFRTSLWWICSGTILSTTKPKGFACCLLLQPLSSDFQGGFGQEWL
jgi:hypothetical protein